MFVEKTPETPDSAILQVRQAVWQMRTPDDLGQVLTAIRRALEEMALPFFSCSLSVVESRNGASVIHFWATTREGQWIKEEHAAAADHPILGFIKNETPVYRPDLEKDDPYNEAGRIRRAYGVPIRCLLDMPYSQGSLSLSSLEPDAFSARHTRILGMLLPHFEDALRRLDDLQALRERNRELERLNKELNDFTAVASHDLKAPLRRIIQFTGLLKQTHEAADLEKSAFFTQHILNQAQNMTDLVNHLLDYAKAGNSENNFRPVPLAGVVDKALDNLSAVLEESNARVEVAPLPTVWGEAVFLAQLFQNLIDNSVKYQDKDVPHIRISAAPDGDMWRIKIQDNGIGIEPQYLLRIFEPFKRLHTQQAFKGTGLGLATCKRIVEDHNGRLWVESRAGEGSTFFATFQDASDAPPAAPAPKAKPPKTFARRPLRILLAEDDPTCLMTADATLRSLGHEVTGVTTGAEALQSFEEKGGHFDILILDIQMPVWSGAEVTSRIRNGKQESGRDIPIIALTARRNDDEELFLSMGFSGFLTKPLDKDRLSEILSRFTSAAPPAP